MAEAAPEKSQYNVILAGKIYQEIDIEKGFSENINQERDGLRVTDSTDATINDDVRLKVVDISDIVDTNSSKSSRMEEAAKNVKKGFKLCPDGFHVFILTLNYEDEFCYTQEEQDTVALLKMMFGKNVIKDHGIIVFTNGEKFSFCAHRKEYRTFQDWCKHRKGALGDLIKECNNRTVLFHKFSPIMRNREVQRMLDLVEKFDKRYTYEMFDQIKGKRDKFIAEAATHEHHETISLLKEIKKQIGESNNMKFKETTIAGLLYDIGTSGRRHVQEMSALDQTMHKQEQQHLHNRELAQLHGEGALFNKPRETVEGEETHTQILENKMQGKQTLVHQPAGQTSGQTAGNQQVQVNQPAGQTAGETEGNQEGPVTQPRNPTTGNVQVLINLQDGQTSGKKNCSQQVLVNRSQRQTKDNQQFLVNQQAGTAEEEETHSNSQVKQQTQANNSPQSVVADHCAQSSSTDQKQQKTTITATDQEQTSEKQELLVTPSATVESSPDDMAASIPAATEPEILSVGETGTGISSSEGSILGQDDLDISDSEQAATPEDTLTAFLFAIAVLILSFL